VFRNKYFQSIVVPISLVILTILLVGCGLVRASQKLRNLMDWDYSDLKLIDPVDAVDPSQDLIAAYARMNDRSLQLRIDFLQLDKHLGMDIYIPMDVNPGGETQIITNDVSSLMSDLSWDYLIKITAAGDIVLVDEHYAIIKGVQCLIVYDSEQDRLVIDVIHADLLGINGFTKFQVIISPPGSAEIADKSVTFSIDTNSPARAKILFAFWNTFSSDTPAQTLRSWTGAHAGPLSGRHGLKYLIDAADRTNSTIFLLDLVTPKNISALDYLNLLPRIQKLSDQSILGLPALGLYDVQAKFQSSSTVVKNSYEKFNPNVYTQWIKNNNLNNIDMQSNLNFILLLNKYINLLNRYYNLVDNDYAQYAEKQLDCKLLPTSTSTNPPTKMLSSDCKRLFLTYAIDQPASPLILGGDFSKSVLGDPSNSSQLFSYIKIHPWIQVLSIQDVATSRDLLSGFPIPNQDRQTSEVKNFQQLPSIKDTKTSSVLSEIYTSLQEAPNNQLTNLAWQVFDSLTRPGSPELLPIRENYIGQIGEILAASNWEKSPTAIQTCTRDLDYDGVNECILANDHIFAIIEPDGGYVPFVFTTDDQGIHQLIGPTWEFIVGLSDPSSWDIASGIRADSAQILGAFQDKFTSWNYYDVKYSSGKIDLYNDNLSMRKSVYIYSNSIQFDIQTTEPFLINPSIPLIVDPWHRFTPRWGDSYIKSDLPSGLRWGILHGEMVGVYSTNPITTFAFNDTRESLAYPENPNFDYLPGHYLPFPMALVDLMSSGNISVDIRINP
jgi:hypothetical protein